MGGISCSNHVLKVGEPRSFGLNHLPTSQAYCTNLTPAFFFKFSIGNISLKVLAEGKRKQKQFSVNLSKKEIWNDMRSSSLNQRKLKQPLLWQDMNKADLGPWEPLFLALEHYHEMTLLQPIYLYQSTLKYPGERIGLVSLSGVFSCS